MKLKYVIIIVLVLFVVYLIYRSNKTMLLTNEVNEEPLEIHKASLNAKKVKIRIKRPPIEKNIEMVVTKKKVLPKVTFRMAKYANKKETVLGDIVFTLFDKIVPKTCENFKSFVKIEYKDTNLFNFKKDMFFCGGDYEKNNGNGKCASSFGQYLEDENFDVKHDKPYMLSMLNEGSPNTNTSKFIITMKPMPEMNGKYVAFGKVKHGKDVIRKINRLIGIPKLEVYVQDAWLM